MSQHGYSPPRKMDSTGTPHEGEVTIDLLIETLTGTAFEMTVSPLDTIATIKSKIHRIEGIPVSAQHLLYNLHELEDSARLLDCSIRNGATLKLVTSMRGGPISNRRFMPSPEERAWMDLVDANRCDNILEHLPSGQLTVLVFCEGEQLNLFRVVENVDGSYSPVTDSVTSTSMRNILSADEPEAAAQRLHENTVTMGKVQDLQRRLSKGMRHRKHSSVSVKGESLKIDSSQTSQDTNACSSSKNDSPNFESQILSQPTLQMTSPSKSALSLMPSKQTHNTLSASSSYSSGSSSNSTELLPHPNGKPLSLPVLEDSGRLTSMSHFPSKSFLPALSFCGTVKKNSAQPSQIISTQRQSRNLSLNLPAPRTIPPPLHAPPLPRRPPLLRPHLTQRQRLPVLQESKRRLPPINSIQNEYTDQPSESATVSLPMCQSQRKLEPITLPNHRSKIQSTSQSSRYSANHLSCVLKDTQQHDMALSYLNEGTKLHVAKIGSVRLQHNGNWLSTQPNSAERTWMNSLSGLHEIQQLSTLSSDNCLIFVDRPVTCPRERLIAHLSASLTRSLSLRFPNALPEQFPLYLASKLIEQLPHRLPFTVSDASMRYLSAQLSERICDCIVDCLANKVPKDMLGQVLYALLNMRMLLSRPAKNLTSKQIPEIEGSPSLSSGDVEKDELCSSDLTNGRVLGYPPFGQAPRFCSPLSLLPSKAHIYRSALTNLQPEPLSLRLTDSSLYQRRSLSGISENSSQCPCPGPSSASSLPSILLNTIHSGPHSVEYVQRVIESSVQRISQPDLPHHLPGEQRQIQILNRGDQVTAPLAVFPHYQEPAQRILFGPNLQSSDSTAPEQTFTSRELSVEPGNITSLPSKLQPSTDVTGISSINHFGSKSSSLTEDSRDNSLFSKTQDESSEEGSKTPKKPHRRCCQCRKKLTISNKYLCRCQKLFCSMHRYSESHDCSYDYKEEGRKLLQQENPQVMAEKIVKM